MSPFSSLVNGIKKTVSSVSRSLNLSRFAIRVGLFKWARKLWNCLACHCVVDDSKGTMRFTFAIPGVITIFLDTPNLPVWLGGKLLAGGDGERAEYGFWHDFHETKVQWCKIINMDAGWEWRIVHNGGEADETRYETIITPMVAECGDAWAKESNIDRWKLTLTTWRAHAHKWWIPTLYDHYFVLYAQVAGESIQRTAELKADLSPRMVACEIFKKLTQLITLH